MTDLWPTDLVPVATRSPVVILREQASLLGQKTKNIVKAEVAKYEIHGGRPFVYAFTRFCSAARHLTIIGFACSSFGFDIELYPVEFTLDGVLPEELELRGPVVSVASEEEFLLTLGLILQSNRTRRVIGAMLSQSMDRGPGNGATSE